MYEFIRGPFIWISFLIFILGLIYQVFRFFSLTQRKELIFADLPFSPDKPPKKTFSQKAAEWLLLLKKRTIWGVHPWMTLITSILHVSLFLIPLTLLGHNILLREAWGISLWSFSESASDVLTLIPLILGAFFLLRRIFVRQVRAITTAYDYLVLLITIAPFVTGYFAYRQWLDYNTMIFLHILSGEIMFITIPFTKLGHMLFFFLYRFFIGTEYSFGRGTRQWAF
jgi:nitrate reductase gamma subunit